MNNKSIDFVNDIGSNKKIQLEEEQISLAGIASREKKGVFFREEYDGNELVISDITHLNITGVDSSKSEIITAPSYATVLNFETCNHISLSSLSIGHSPKSGYCTGGVVDFRYCYDVVMENLVLYGCGTYGVELEACANVIIRNTIIKECTYGIFSVVTCKNVLFENCCFVNNLAYSCYIRNAEDVHFKNCKFENNEKGDFFDEYMLHLSSNRGIVFSNCSFDRKEVLVSPDEEYLIEFA